MGPCDKYTALEKMEVWRIFRQKIRPIRRWYNEILEKREEKKNNFLKGFTNLTEAIMNGDKGIVDLQNYITENGDIKLEPIESQKIMGIVKLIFSHFEETRSEEVGENEKEQETNNRFLECRKEFESIEERRKKKKERR